MQFFMQQEFQWSAAQTAKITGAFFPGCMFTCVVAKHPSPFFTLCRTSVSDFFLCLDADMLTQIPAGWIANRFGGKDILT